MARKLPRDSFGHTVPIGSDVIQGYFTTAGTDAVTATTTPTGGTFDADNWGGVVQCAVSPLYIAFNGEVATAHSIYLLPGQILYVEHIVSSISIIATTSGAELRWKLLVGGTD